MNEQSAGMLSADVHVVETSINNDRGAIQISDNNQVNETEMTDGEQRELQNARQMSDMIKLPNLSI